jgi:hypothetical protein
MKRELWGQTACSTILLKLAAACVFEKWVEHCKKCIAKGGTSKKRLSLHLCKVLTPSNKVSPWTLQTA